MKWLALLTSYSSLLGSLKCNLAQQTTLKGARAPFLFLACRNAPTHHLPMRFTGNIIEHKKLETRNKNMSF